MNKVTFLKSSLLLCALVVGSGSVWAADPTKTETFEGKGATTTYNSTVTISTTESSCGIAWTIYYGAVSTNDKISGSNSCQMRWYASATSNSPYAQTTTPIDNLYKVALKARTSNLNVKMDVCYSADGTTWTVGTTYTFNDTGKGEDVELEIPAGNKYVKFGVSSSSTAPSSSNYKLIIDDVVFTYSEASKTATTTTITAPVGFNSDLKNGTDAGTLTASVISGGSPVEGAIIAWSSSDENVATVDGATGAVTLVGVGSATITASYAGDATYASSSDTYALTVSDTRAEADLAYATTTQNVATGEVLSAPALTNPHNVPVTFTSGDIKIATVDAIGNVTGVAKGSTTITATFAGNSTYKASSASYTINVSRVTPFNSIWYESFDTNNEGGGNDGIWSNISTTPDPDFDLSGWATEKVYAASECVRTGKKGSLTTPDLGVAGDVTLKFRMASWGSDTNSGYVDIIDGGTFDDGTSTQKTVSIQKSKWDSFELKLLGVTTGTKIKFSDNGNDKRLFIDEVEILLDKQPVTITAAEYATSVSTYARDFSTTGITAYTATDAGNSVTLNKITSGKVPANTPVVLYKAGADGTAINVPVIASADAPAGTNNLRVSTGTDVEKEKMYVLSKKSGKVGFYKWAGSSDLSAGKVYLQASSPSAPDFLGFDGETTAVEGVKAESVESGEYFNLAGQRVAQPTKGLYIVNGKKVVVK